MDDAPLPVITRAPGTMLERVQAYRRKDARRRVQQGTTTALMMGGLLAVAALLPYGIVAVGCGLLSTFVILRFIAVVLPAGIPRTVVVLDRATPHSETTEPGGLPAPQVLTLLMDELDAVGRAHGGQGLRRFIAVVKLGAPSFTPEEGLAELDLLERHATELAAPLPEVLLVVAHVRARLERARSGGARFCLMAPGGWSGLMETNVGLHWVG